MNVDYSLFPANTLKILPGDYRIAGIKGSATPTVGMALLEADHNAFKTLPGATLRLPPSRCDLQGGPGNAVPAKNDSKYIAANLRKGDLPERRMGNCSRGRVKR